MWYAIDAGQSRVAFAQGVANKTRDNDKLVVAANQAYADGVSEVYVAWQDKVETEEWECLRAKKGLEYQIAVGLLNSEDVTPYQQQFAGLDEIRDRNVANFSGEQMIALATKGQTRTKRIAELKVGLARDVAQE